MAEAEQDPQPPRRWQFSLKELLAVTTLVSLGLSFGHWLGPNGAMLVVYGVVVVIYCANLCKSSSLFGVRIPRITLGEFVVVIAICFIMHGLMMPAWMPVREFGGHRPRPPQPVVTSSPHSPTAKQSPTASIKTEKVVESP